MKLTMTESVSLDGVMQGLGGPDEDRRLLFRRYRPGRSARSGRHPNHTQRGDDPSLPAQRATGVRNVHREGKLATKLTTEEAR